MGAGVVKRYDMLIDDYVAKKEMKKQKADREIDMTMHMAIQKVQENRYSYDKINKNNKFGKAPPYQTEMEVSALLRQSSKTKLPLNFSDLGSIRD